MRRGPFLPFLSFGDGDVARAVASKTPGSRNNQGEPWAGRAWGRALGWELPSAFCRVPPAWQPAGPVSPPSLYPGVGTTGPDTAQGIFTFSISFDS